MSWSFIYLKNKFIIFYCLIFYFIFRYFLIDFTIKMLFGIKSYFYSSKLFFFFVFSGSIKCISYFCNFSNCKMKFTYIVCTKNLYFSLLFKIIENLINKSLIIHFLNKNLFVNIFISINSFYLLFFFSSVLKTSQ